MIIIFNIRKIMINDKVKNPSKIRLVSRLFGKTARLSYNLKSLIIIKFILYDYIFRRSKNEFFSTESIPPSYAQKTHSLKAKIIHIECVQFDLVVLNSHQYVFTKGWRRGHAHFANFAGAVEFFLWLSPNHKLDIHMIEQVMILCIVTLHHLTLLQ